MSLFDDLPRFSKGRNRRISSYDRTGGNADRIFLAAGETVNLADIRGSGVIRHIWITYGHDDPMALRNMIVRMYWDGEKRPSVQSPLGDLFGQGWGENYPVTSLPLCATPKRSVVSYFPMPFSDGARIELENDSASDCLAFYYYVDYEEREVGEEEGRFHAEWRRRLNHPAEAMENEWRAFDQPAKNLTDAANHLFIDAVGRGHYVGINYYVECPTPMWYGEGDDMFFIDGESWPPSLHGTGTEDYFNSSYCPKEAYCAPLFGYPRVNAGETGWLGRTHCYRFHLPDPVLFQKSLRGSIECGHADSLTLDLVTVAYWYQTEPHKPFAAFPERAGRANMPAISPSDIHRWRGVWRQMQGGNPWGNEPLPEKFLGKVRAAAAKGRARIAPAKAAAQAEKESRAYEKMLNRRKGGKSKTGKRGK